MSLKKRVTRLSELPETELNSRTLDQLMGLEIYRNILTVKYHMNKLIVFPEDLHVTKKMAVWLKGKFAGYTMTFNRDFDLCIEEILNAYPETWLCPELVEKFKLINRNPASIPLRSGTTELLWPEKSDSSPATPTQA